MKKLPLMMMGVVAFGMAACTTHQNTDLPPGTYKSSVSSEKSDGTDYSSDTTTKVKIEDGKKVTTTKTKDTTDPEGWFNKSTTKTKTTTVK